MMQRHKAVRALLIALGTFCLVLGIIGIVLPLLPSTPLFLAAAACYMRSSERLYSWLINNRFCGKYIRNYQEGKGIPLKIKITAITVLWASILFSIFFLISHIWVMQVVLLVIAVGVSVHLLRLPTCKGDSKQ